MNELFRLNGCTKWHDFYGVDCSLYLLFIIIVAEIIVVYVLSYLIISKPRPACYRNQLLLVCAFSEFLLCWLIMMPWVVRNVVNYSINDCPCDMIVCYLLDYNFSEGKIIASILLSNLELCIHTYALLHFI